MITSWATLDIETYFNLGSKQKLGIYIEMLNVLPQYPKEIDRNRLMLPTSSWTLEHYNNYLEANKFCEGQMKFTADKVEIPISPVLLLNLVCSNVCHQTGLIH